MSRLFPQDLPRRCALGVALTLLTVALLNGCGALRSTQTGELSVYAIDGVGAIAPVSASVPARVAAGVLAGATIIVNPPRAASGFDSRRIVYVREPHKLEYFAHSEWVDTPARMLAPLIVNALEAGDGAHAVVSAPSAVAGDLRVDTEIVRLQHDFSRLHSRVRFTLRAQVVDIASRAILASRELEATVVAHSDDPYGGVVAANRAVHEVLQQLSELCTRVAGDWRSTKHSPDRTGSWSARSTTCPCASSETR